MNVRFVPQCGPSYQGIHQDRHKTQFLADIIDSKVLTARITAHNADNEIDYETFYSMLTSALTLLENKKSTETHHEEILYGAQYGRPSKPRPYHRLRNSPPFPRFQDPKTYSTMKERKANNECFICKQKGHWKNECPNRHSTMTEIIKARIKERGNNNKAAAEVLFSIAQEDDSYQEFIDSQQPETGHDENCDNENTFETLINDCYEDNEAKEDIENIFEDLIGNMDETAGQDFQ